MIIAPSNRGAIVVTNITIHSQALSVEIAPMGAELQTIRDMAGRDYLHDGSSYWASRAPLLFPIVGALKNNTHVVDGAAYYMQRHGFARHSMFEAVATSADRARFRLADSEATRAEYPYKFLLEGEYALTGAKLTMSVTVTNIDTKPIPVAFGFHPAFRWPLPGAGAKLEQVVDFALDEPGPLTRIDSDGLIARELESPVMGRRLTLADAFFEDDALIFLSLNSRSLRFGPVHGGSPAVKIDFEGMPHLGIWTKPGAPYLCIEPWSGYASPAAFSGPLTEKPGSINLTPGEGKNFAMSVELV